VSDKSLPHPFTEEEISAALKKTKPATAPGYDNIHVEVLMNLGQKSRRTATADWRRPSGLNTEDIADLITNHQLSYHLYADDTQLLGSTSTSNIRSTVDRLQSCVAAIHQWCDSRRLQLNPTKTELIWFGYLANLQKIATTDQSLGIDRDIIHSVALVRDLRVTLDSELILQRHVNKVTSACFYHICRLKQICLLLGPDVATSLVSAFVSSRLDYCNAILAGLPKTTIAPLQRAQNAAARLVVAWTS